MRSISLRFFVMAVVVLSGYGQCFAADANVEVLSGHVKTVLEKKDISVFLLDKDGSILDITGLDGQGNFQIDPTVMDDPLYSELTKLKLIIKYKKGTQKEVKISENIDEFLDKKVKLGDQIFP